MCKMFPVLKGFLLVGHEANIHTHTGKRGVNSLYMRNTPYPFLSTRKSYIKGVFLYKGVDPRFSRMRMYVSLRVTSGGPAGISRNEDSPR